MGDGGTAGGLILQGVTWFDGVEAVEANMAEGVVVGHLVVPVTDLPIQNTRGRQVVDVTVLHCRVGRLLP